MEMRKVASDFAIFCRFLRELQLLSLAFVNFVLRRRRISSAKGGRRLAVLDRSNLRFLELAPE